MFFEQFNKLCIANNTTPTRFTIDILQLSSSKVTAWKNGSIPLDIYRTLTESNKIRFEERGLALIEQQKSLLNQE